MRVGPPATLVTALLLAACDSPTLTTKNYFDVADVDRVAYVGPRPSVTLTQPASGTYVVQNGDTLGSVAQRFGVDRMQLARVNGLPAPHTLRPGQSLILPGALAQIAASAPTEVTSRSPTAQLPYAPVPPAATPKTAPAPAQTNRAATPPAATARTAPAPLPAAPARAGFAWPVRGEVVSAFGVKGGGVANDGIDIRAAAGLPVVAVDNGVVAYAGNELKALGNLVLVQHAGNWTSAYANTGGITVQRGQTVTRGQQVATTGQSGNAKVTGLHFELRRGTEAVDPLKYLPPSQVAER